jgi:hypothetical protein
MTWSHAMRPIGRAISELVGVLTAGFIAFFVMLAYAAGLLLLLACGFVGAGFVLVALFSMIMWLFTGDTHALLVMLGYGIYAAGTFAMIAALSFYHGKFMDGMKARRYRSIAQQRTPHHELIELH